jgi:hypothetical protein
LHAQEAVERPFSVKLDDRLGGSDALFGDYVLAGIVTFSWAIPEKQAAQEGWEG